MLVSHSLMSAPALSWKPVITTPGCSITELRPSMLTISQSDYHILLMVISPKIVSTRLSPITNTDNSVSRNIINKTNKLLISDSSLIREMISWKNHSWSATPSPNQSGFTDVKVSPIRNFSSTTISPEISDPALFPMSSGIDSEEPEIFHKVRISPSSVLPLEVQLSLFNSLTRLNVTQMNNNHKLKLIIKVFPESNQVLKWFPNCEENHYQNSFLFYLSKKLS